MLLVTPLEPRTGAWGASGAGPECQLITDGRHVGCWVAAAAPGEAPCRRWQQRLAGGGRVEFAAPLPAPEGGQEAFVLLVTSHGPTAPAQAAVVAISPSPGGQAVVATAALVNDLHDGAPTHPTFSNPACRSGSVMLAASLSQGTVHLVQAERSGGGSGAWQLSVSSHNLCQLLTTDPGTPATTAFCCCCCCCCCCCGGGGGCPGGHSPAVHSLAFPRPLVIPPTPHPLLLLQAPALSWSRWRWALPAAAWPLATACTAPSCMRPTGWAAG